MQDIFKSNQYNFQLIGDPSQTLQLILLKDQSVWTNLPNIIYMSKNLKLKKTKMPWWKRLRRQNSNNPEFIHKIKNKAEAVEYVGISKLTGGKILCINPNIFDGKMIIRYGTLLAYTSEISIKKRLSMDLQMRNEEWVEGTGDGIIFLQTPSILIEKRLSSDEEILVSKNSIIAWSKNVRITYNTANNSFGNTFFYGWAQANVKGPGVVYIEGNGLTVEERKKEKLNLWMKIFVYWFLISLIILFFQALFEEFSIGIIDIENL